MMTDRLRVAFLGMGRMGSRMARKVSEAKYPLIVWNRTSNRLTPLRNDGIEVVETPAEAAHAADIVVTMLTDGESVGEVLFDRGVADSMKVGSIFVDMSSIPPAVAALHEKALGAKAIGCLDAPVSGGTRGAEQGALTILVGGDERSFATCRPVLETMGKPTLIGPAASGQMAKLANQIIVAATIGGVAEAFLLGAAAGLNNSVVREALSGGFADSRVLAEHGVRMIERDFEAGGAVALHLKDLRTALGEAQRRGLTMPLSKKIAGLFQGLVDRGDADADHSALLVELERINDAHHGLA